MLNIAFPLLHSNRANLREHLKSVHKTGIEPLPRGRRKGHRKDMTVQMMETIQQKDPDPQQGQQTLQYEVLTTRPHPEIDQENGQQQVGLLSLLISWSVGWSLVSWPFGV